MWAMHQNPMLGATIDAALAAPDKEGTTMTATMQDTIQTSQALLNALNSGNFDAWEAALAPDVTFSYPGLRGGCDRATARAYNEPFPAAFSDLHFAVTRTIVEGDAVVTCWLATGTHDGPLALPTGTVPPTGRRGEIPGVLIATMRDGKIVREETYWNQIELLAQLGLM